MLTKDKSMGTPYLAGWRNPSVDSLLQVKWPEASAEVIVCTSDVLKSMATQFPATTKPHSGIGGGNPLHGLSIEAYPTFEEVQLRCDELIRDGRKVAVLMVGNAQLREFQEKQR